MMYQVFVTYLIIISLKSFIMPCWHGLDYLLMEIPMTAYKVQNNNMGLKGHDIDQSEEEKIR